MVFSHVFSGLIDLSNDKTKQTAGNLLVNLVKPLVNNIVNLLLDSDFSFQDFTFDKKAGSGLTGKSGVYLIINKPKKRVYLGGCADLSQRKGEHKLSLTNPTRTQKKLALAMREDLRNGSAEDFFFVPLLIIPPTAIKGLSNTEQSFTVNQQITSFIDAFVEKPCTPGL